MTDPSRPPLRWVFVTSTITRPTGGDIALFELVNALARGGHGHVRVVHAPFLDGSRVRGLADLPWVAFEPTVEHEFATNIDPATLGDADVVVYTMKLLAAALAPTAVAGGPALIDALQHGSGIGGLPVLLLQGQGVFGREVEELGLHLPGPKVCVGSWLAEDLARRGVPVRDIVHIPNGVDPRTFRITRPIEARHPQVAMNFDPHPVKGGLRGLAALERAHAERGLAALVFGTRAPDRELGPGLRFVPSPPRAAIAEEIYNASSLYLQPSQQEGFGMSAVEAMACGCALVTTANGGSDDYAFDGETAVVCGTSPEEIADALVHLTGDDARRERIARNGSRFVERFRWSASADRLAQVARERLADATPKDDQ